MQTLTVALGARSYPIHIGAGLLDHAELIVERLPQKKAVIVTNATRVAGQRTTRCWAAATRNAGYIREEAT